MATPSSPTSLLGRGVGLLRDRPLVAAATVGAAGLAVVSVFGSELIAVAAVGYVAYRTLRRRRAALAERSPQPRP
jgi:hypothetical protein